MLVACSGGVDSMVLCDLLKEHHFSFSIAHCNFQLRGEESKADEELVKEYGVVNNIPVFIKRFDTITYKEQNKLSTQVAARELRYAWFKELLESHSFKLLLTAHHADDNVETVLMNLFKGTGILGMKGILPKRENIVRPLLFATKKEIIDYAALHQLEWREDASNATQKYTRNFFRNRIIPQIEEVIPGASININKSIDHLQQAEILYRQAIENYRGKLLKYYNQEVHIPVIKFSQCHPFETIAYELLSPFGFKAASVEYVKQLLTAETGKYISSLTHRIIKNRNWLIIAPVESTGVENIVIEEKDQTVFFENGSIQISRTTNNGFDKNPLVASLDAKKIDFPLLLRRWKTGDYFYPLGMPKKKKVARFMIDQKLSKTDKEKVWVLVSNNKILWVVGHRIDDRFKVTPGSAEVIRFKWIG